MYGQMLKTDPVGLLIWIAYYMVVVLTSLILHECAHGYVAWRCGDPTAKMMGRLSLDPRKHLDPMGTISMVLFGFGWAKPVPVNPRNFRSWSEGDGEDRARAVRRDDFLVSIAGILTNFSLFLVCLALAVGINGIMWKPGLYSYYIETHRVIELISPYSGVGGSIAYAGSISSFGEYLAQPWLIYVQRFLLLMTTVNLALAVFNFLPIPPLDGYHIFNDLLLKGRFQLNSNTFRIAQTVLLLLCFSGALSGLLSTVNSTVYDAVLGVMLRIAGVY